MQSNNIVLVAKGLIFKDGKILVLEKSDGRWDLPGGKLEQGENYEDGLLREVSEETRLRVKIRRHLSDWSIWKNPELLIIGSTYLCDLIGGDLQLSEEHSAHFWFDSEEIQREKICYRYGLDRFEVGFRGIL